MGIADVMEKTGKEINLEAFKNLPQLLFMGGLDENDAIEFDNAYSDKERAIGHNAFAKTMMPHRWGIVKSVYKEMGIKANVITVKDIGHGTDLALNTKISDFFKKNG